MITKATNAQSAGGSGFTYEHRVAALYATALVCGQTAPGVEGKIVSRVELQRKAAGDSMDDLVVEAMAPDLSVYRLGLQVKKCMTISAADSNDDFREVIEAAYATITSSKFDSRFHRVGAVVGEFTSASAYPSFVRLCSAAAHQAASSFAYYYGVNGGIAIVTSKVVREQYRSVLEILSPLVKSGRLADEVHRLLSHFVLLEVKLGYPGAPDEVRAEQMIRAYLVDEAERAASFWKHMLDMMNLGAALHAEFDREKIIVLLDGQFRLPNDTRHYEPRTTTAENLPRGNRRRILAVAAVGVFALGGLTWLFTQRDYSFLDSITSGVSSSVPVPGRSLLERQINLAKMEGAAALTSSTEFATAVPFARPSLARGEGAQVSGADVFAFSNASPLRSENQDLVFGAGRCRFLGRVAWSDQSVPQAQALIDGLSCVLDNRDAYSLRNPDGAPIGFVARIETPESETLILVDDGKSVTLPLNQKYIVRFFKPIKDISFKGKSSVAW